MLSPQTYRRIALISAWYDLFVALPFATPPGLAILWSLLGGLEATLGLTPLPGLSVYAVLFGNFFGTVVTIWSILRLRGDVMLLGRYDAVGRGLFSLWMVNALMAGASPLIWGFLAIEVGFGILQSLPVRAKPSA